MKVEISPFGNIEDTVINEYTLTNANDMQVKILNYGGIITAITLTDKQGKRKNCIQGFDTLQGYIEDPSYQGAIVGRYANRIGHGTFTLDGQVYHLDKNGGQHNLHGGIPGFHKKVWDGKCGSDDDSAYLVLTLHSPDGEGGFPGNVAVEACYRLDNNNVLSLEITATTDRATPLSFTQHAYFTLSNAPTVGTTRVQINADGVTDADASLLPTGDIKKVEGTVFDFRKLTKIEEKISQCQLIPLFNMVGGYDHNFVLNNAQDSHPQALVKADDTGISMALYTSLPGLQFYTGSLKSSEQLGALCLEPQHFPDAPNKPQFPNCITTPEQPFHMTIHYHFSVE
ncbi:galactose mutarotase [Alteromonas sp. D210916BOD_24]|uniref:aldose epimerase family protein n=1 Tax=Alteromonas sp. D210916BOD_24 TaxID=3157618 RepID=UPI00399D010E